MWECPDFFALGDRFALIVSVYDGKRPVHVVYFLGRYEQHRLLPQQEGLLDFGASFYAPQSLKDSQGRRILWGWLREQRSPAAQAAAGWSGVMSLPRILSLSPTGTLTMEPAPELQTLRGEHHSVSNVTVGQGAPLVLEGVHGLALEIIAELEPGDADVFGLSLCRSPDGAEETRILYDCRRGGLAIDARRSSLGADADRQAPVRWGEVALSRQGLLRLHIFLDHSVVEVFAQDAACSTARIYPSRRDSREVALFAEGGSAMLHSMEIWEMGSIWDQRPSRPPAEQPLGVLTEGR
jgi:beta-fructofuranosidase